MGSFHSSISHRGTLRSFRLLPGRKNKCCKPTMSKAKLRIDGCHIAAKQHVTWKDLNRVRT